MNGLSGLGGLSAGAFVGGGPVLSGQGLRAFEVVANTFDPTAGAGLQRPVGSRVASLDGTKAWDKTSSTATGWVAAGSSSATFTGQVLLWSNVPNGGGSRADSPSISWAEDTGHDTGLYFPAENTIGHTNNGISRWIEDNARIAFTTRLCQGMGFPDQTSGDTITLPNTGNVFRVALDGAHPTIRGIVFTNWLIGGFAGLPTNALAPRITLILAAGITVSHNDAAPGLNAAPIILAGGVSLTTTGTYLLDLIHDGTNWVQLSFGWGSGALPIAKGGTGASSAGAAFDALQASPPTLAAAATLNVGAQSSFIVFISGTAAVTALDVAPAGVRRRLVFLASNGTFTHNAASLILPTTTGFTWSAGDTIEFLSLGAGNWRAISQLEGAGGLVGSYVLNQSNAGVLGYASTNVVTWSDTLALFGVPIRGGSGGNNPAAPQFTYQSDQTSGMYMIAAGDVGFSASSTRQMHVSPNGLQHDTRHQARQGATVASAATITLGGDGNMFPLSGTTPVTAISSTNWQAGARVTVVPASALITLGHSAAANGIKTKTGAAFAPVAGAAYDLIFDGSNWLLI